jgi:SH3-like domain-containing protein
VRTIALLLLALSAAGPALAAPCDISAYVIDRDPKGLSLRAAPSSKARIVARVSNKGSGVADITGYQNGWFRVTNMTDYEDDAPLFRGLGWVHRSLLHVDIAAYDPNLYAAPSSHPRRIKKLSGDMNGVTLLACSGRWAQVRIEGVVGWLSHGGQSLQSADHLRLSA